MVRFSRHFYATEQGDLLCFSITETRETTRSLAQNMQIAYTLHMLKNVQFRVEADLKTRAEALFGELGMDMPTAFRMFLKKSVDTKSIPFRIEKEPHFSKKEVRELVHLLRQAKKGENVAGPFKNSRAILDYLHNEGIHQQ